MLETVNTDNLRPSDWFIERSRKDADGNEIYEVVFIGGTFEKTLEKLIELKGNKETLEMWSQNWTDTHVGYAPAASIKGGNLRLHPFIQTLAAPTKENLKNLFI
jgi:hypothetical protein